MKAKIILLTLCVTFTAISAVAQAQKTTIVKSKSNITNNRASIETALTANEKMAWKNLVDKKFDDFAKMFADDYQGIYDFEVTTKASEVAQVKQMTFNSADVSDIKVKFLDNDAAIVTSMVKADMVMPDKMKMNDNFRATTIYVKRGTQWLIVYHSHIAVKTM